MNDKLVASAPATAVAAHCPMAGPAPTAPHGGWVEVRCCDSSRANLKKQMTCFGVSQALLAVSYPTMDRLRRFRSHQCPCLGGRTSLGECQHASNNEQRPILEHCGRSDLRTVE
eukprot:1637206-Amphidinium_carterae.1